MNYFFPSIFESLKFPCKEIPSSFHHVNSGENAIRLLLRSYGLKAKAKIAVPLYVCDSLKEAILKEGFEPLYLDLKPDRTFWPDYNALYLLDKKPNAVILVHLYGFLHPDTVFVMDFCKNNAIPLIHDAAQSYGINEELLNYNSGLVYSFGPGKSTTAAGGAIVKGLSNEFYKQNCHTVSNFSMQSYKAKLFLKSRIYRHEYSFVDKLAQKIIFRFKANNPINGMTKFQLIAAATAIQLVNEKRESRRERYKILEEVVKTNALLNIPYNHDKGLYFKMVIGVAERALEFKEYLRDNKVPFFSLKSELFIDEDKYCQFPEFCKYADSFIELSTEASLPLKEIQRIADIIRQYS